MINKITIYKQLPFKNKFPLKQKEQFDQKHFCDHLPLIPPQTCMISFPLWNTNWDVHIITLCEEQILS